jgi:hypothetical protein
LKLNPDPHLLRAHVLLARCLMNKRVEFIFYPHVEGFSSSVKFRRGRKVGFRNAESCNAAFAVGVANGLILRAASCTSGVKGRVRHGAV